MQDRERDRRKVKIACAIPNGVTLRLYRPSASDHDDKVMVPVGPSFQLPGPPIQDDGTIRRGSLGTPVITEVDAEWWDRWFSQNRGSTLLAAGGIRKVDDDDSEQPTDHV